MPESQFRKMRDAYLETVASGTVDPRISSIETHLGGAASESGETQRHEDRIRALMKYFFTSIIECAESVADEEIGPIDGMAKEPKDHLRPDSLYYEYHLARKSAFAGFSPKQRMALKGLVLRTAFETMFKIAIRLEDISEHEVDILLLPKCAQDIKHLLHQSDIDGHPYWDDELPAHLTKYEY